MLFANAVVANASAPIAVRTRNVRVRVDTISRLLEVSTTLTVLPALMWRPAPACHPPQTMSEQPVEPIARAERPIAAGTRIGHVHLRTADIYRVRSFYVGVLG